MLSDETARTPAGWLPVLRDTLARERRLLWPMAGRSMLPTLQEGCEVEIVPLPASVPLGSLLLFVQHDRFVVHRLVRRVGERWIMQGDAMPVPDRAVGEGALLGMVVAAHREGRRCWPKRGERARAAGWIVRYHRLRAGRALKRWWAHRTRQGGG